MQLSSLDVNQFLSLVQGQQGYHAKQAGRPDVPLDKAERHKNLADSFSRLSSFLADMDTEKSDIIDPYALPKQLRIGDISDLPQELRNELNLTQVDETEQQIIDVVRSFRGVAAVDEILVGLWRQFKTVQKRQALAGKLYRMTRKELLHSVPKRRGLYALLPVSAPEGIEEDEAED